MQGLVAYKPLAYKSTPTPPSKPLFQAIYLPPAQTKSPNLHQHINKHLLIFTFCKSQTNRVSVALEPWRVEGWSSQGLVISALSAGVEAVGRIWDVRVSTYKNIGWFDMELPYYYHYYIIVIIIIIIIFMISTTTESQSPPHTHTHTHTHHTHTNTHTYTYTK